MYTVFYQNWTSPFAERHWMIFWKTLFKLHKLILVCQVLLLYMYCQEKQVLHLCKHKMARELQSTEDQTLWEICSWKITISQIIWFSCSIEMFLFIFCTLTVKYESNNFCHVTLISQYLNLCRRNAWFTKSKAFERSQKLPMGDVWLFIVFNISSVTTYTAFSVE